MTSGTGTVAALRTAAYRGLAWSAVYRWSARVVSFATFAVLGRLLEPADFGLVALAASFASFLALLTDFGVPLYVVHAADVDERARSTVLWSSLGLGCAVGALQVAVAAPAAAVLGSPHLAPVLMVMSIGYPLSALYGVMAALQKRELHFRRLAIRGMVAVATSAAIAVALAVAGFGVWSLVAQSLAYPAASIATLWVYEPWRPRALWSPSTFRDALRYGRSALGATLMDTVSSSSDSLVVGRRLGTVDLGYYAVATKTVRVLLDALVGIVFSVANPIMARAQDDRAMLAAAYRRAVTQGTLVAAPVLALLAATSPQLLGLLFGPKWLPAAGVTSVLAVAEALRVPVWFDKSLLYAVGRVGLELRLAVLEAATVVVAVLTGAAWGLTGVAVALLVRNLVIWPVRLTVSARVTAQSAVRLAWHVGRLWLAAAVAGVAAAAAADLVSAPVLALLLAGTAATAVYVAVTAVVARSELTYAWRTVVEPRRRRASRDRLGQRS